MHKIEIMEKFLFIANYSLTSPILVNHVSLEQFSSAYGLLLLVQGKIFGPKNSGNFHSKIPKEGFSVKNVTVG